MMIRPRARTSTGQESVTIEAILERRVSDTTLRSRRDEWITAGVFDELRDHALDAYDRIIGVDLFEVALDGSLHKAPCGGEGTDKSPVDRVKLGWKWSMAADANGIPLGRATAGANRNELKLSEPTLVDVVRSGLLSEIETLDLNRGCDYPKVRTQLAKIEFNDLNIQRRTPPGADQPKPPMRLGLRWVVEGTRRAESYEPSTRTNSPMTRASSSGESSMSGTSGLSASSTIDS